MTDCVRGCRRGGHHRSECTASNCIGCAPRQAHIGLLCLTCFERLRLMLVGVEADERGEPAPGLVEVQHWLLTNLDRTTNAAATDDQVRHTKAEAPPIPIRVDILDLIGETAAVTRSWTTMAADDANLHGPESSSVHSSVGFLATHLERIAAADWVRDLWDELADLSSRAHALAPWRREVRRCPGIPCPDCQRPALVVFGGDDVVSCQSCRAVFDRGRYEIWTRILIEDARASVSPAEVA